MASEFKSRKSSKNVEKMNLIANVKALTELCYLMQDEAKLKEVNSKVKELMCTINDHLSKVNNGLFERPKGTKRKNDTDNNLAAKKPKDIPTVAKKPKHPYSGRVGKNAEMMRKYYKVKLSLDKMEGLTKVNPKKRTLDPLHPADPVDHTTTSPAKKSPLSPPPVICISPEKDEDQLLE